MPPVTPSSTRRPAKGRSGPLTAPPSATGRTRADLLGGTAARHHAILDLAHREVLERARGQLLLPAAATRHREPHLVQGTRILGGDEDAQILVRRVLRYFDRREDSHDLLTSWIVSEFPSRAPRPAP